MGFEHEDDARRFLDAMRTRLEGFMLSLHPDKTRLIEFWTSPAKVEGFSDRFGESEEQRWVRN